MSKELFKIACVTCNARLSVRNASVIGQILSCPRCGSMVQVTPPADFVGASGTNDSVAETPQSVQAPPVQAPPEQVPPEQVPPEQVNGATANDSFDDIPDVPADTAATTETAASAGEAVDDVAAASVEQLASQTSQYQWIAWGVAALTAGAIVMGTILSLRDSGRQREAAASTDAPAEAAAQAQPTLPTEQSDQAAPDASIEESASTPTAPVVPVEVADAAVANEQSPMLDDPAKEAAQEAAAVETASSAESATAEAKPALSAGAPDGSPQPKLHIDPLDLDPESLNMNAITGEAESPRLSVPESSEDDMPNEALAHEQAVEQPVENAPVKQPPVRLDPEQPAAPSHASELLAVEFPAITIKAMPLCDFLEFTTRLSAVPVSVSPDELILAGVSATRAVSIDAADIALENLLSEALKPLRLEPEVVANQVVLRRSGVEGKREIEYPIDDLLGAETSAASLAELVQRFVAPQAWAEQGGAGSVELAGAKLRIAQDERIQYEVLRFFENLRLARGLKPRSNYPAGLLSASSPYVELRDALAAPTTFTFSRYTALDEVIRHWRDELGIAVLVDWPALAKAELYPQSRIACSATNESWHAALDNVLTPLGLAWRAIDRRTLQITTQAAATADMQIGFYSLAAKPRVELATIERQLERFRGEAASDGSMAVAMDDASHTLIVRDSAMVHRQLASWLME